MDGAVARWSTRTSSRQRAAILPTRCHFMTHATCVRALIRRIASQAALGGARTATRSRMVGRGLEHPERWPIGRGGQSLFNRTSARDGSSPGVRKSPSVRAVAPSHRRNHGPGAQENRPRERTNMREARGRVRHEICACATFVGLHAWLRRTEARAPVGRYSRASRVAQVLLSLRLPDQSGIS